MKFEQGDPVLVAFVFESLLGRAKYVQRLTEAPHLHERDAVKRSGLRLFIAHSDLVELFDCPVRKSGSVFRQVELEVDFCFVEVA